MAKVFLDYGHGGSDSGAVANGVVEKTANLVTGLSCAAELRRHGVTISEARTTDVFISLDARTSKANSLGVDYFVSIHHNAGGGDRGEGIHSIYRGQGEKLANSILDEMAAKIGQQKKVYEKRGTDNKDYYHVIRNTNMDAVIVEVCFLDNKADVQIADTVPEQQRTIYLLIQLRNIEMLLCTRKVLQIKIQLSSLIEYLIVEAKTLSVLQIQSIKKDLYLVLLYMLWVAD